MVTKAVIHTPAAVGTGRKNVHCLFGDKILFLAGPIKNAPLWHNDAIITAMIWNKYILIASPQGAISEHLQPYLVQDYPTYEIFERQREWEQHYMYRAEKYGVIVFWLPDKILPEEYPEKEYGHISMLELGKWIERKKFNPNLNLVIGTDGDFPQWDTIRYEIKKELGEKFPIYGSLVETINAAMSVL